MAVNLPLSVNILSFPTKRITSRECALYTKKNSKTSHFPATHFKGLETFHWWRIRFQCLTFMLNIHHWPVKLSIQVGDKGYTIYPSRLIDWINNTSGTKMRLQVPLKVLRRSELPPSALELIKYVLQCYSANGKYCHFLNYKWSHSPKTNVAKSTSSIIGTRCLGRFESNWLTRKSKNGQTMTSTFIYYSDSKRQIEFLVVTFHFLLV